MRHSQTTFHLPDEITLPDRSIVRPAVGTLRMACINEIGGFRALGAEWAGLHDSCPDSNPFNSWEWLFSWWQAYGHGKQLRLLTSRLDGRLVGIAPLYLVREKFGVGLSVRVMRMIGDGSADSDYLDFLIRPELRSTVVSLFCERLISDRTSDVLALRELSQTSVVPATLERIAVRHKLSFRVEDGTCSAVEIPKTFDDFLQSRPPRFRTKLRAFLKKLDEGDLHVETDACSGTLRRRLRSLFALHQSRWRAAGREGVFNERAKRQFYAHFAPRFARRGWLRLYSLRFGDRYLAHQLCFGMRGVTYVLQEGFDVSDRSASYGQILRAAVMRRLIEQGETRYDFLGGITKHKQDWGAVEGKIFRLAVRQARARSWLYFKLPLWRDASAEVAKRWLPAPAIRILKRAREAFS